MLAEEGETLNRFIPNAVETEYRIQLGESMSSSALLIGTWLTQGKPEMAV